MLRMKNTLEATIAQAKFQSLKFKHNMKLAIADISNPLFWKAVFTLLRAVYPALRCLRICDTNVPAMDKVATLTHRTTVALEQSVESLNDTWLFDKDASIAGLDEEQRELYGLDERFHDM